MWEYKILGSGAYGLKPMQAYGGFRRVGLRSIGLVGFIGFWII